MASVEMIVKGANGNLVKQPIAAPVGSVIAFAADAVPTHCLACNGAAISRTAYPELFAVIGTTYGAGDGVNTFNLPDFRGKFLRCVGGNSAAIGVAQSDENKVHKHVVYIADATGSLKAGLYASSPYDNNQHIVPIAGSTMCHGQMTANSGEYQAAEVGEIENRPVNMAVKYCIVFE